MVIILKGSPFNGGVSLTGHGPFKNEDDAVKWAVEWLDGEPEWFVLEVHSPREIEDGMGEIVDVPVEELERMIAEKEGKSKKLPKEILLDLSGIPEGV